VLIKTITEKIKELLSQKKPIIIAIDGRCGAGKSTLSKKLADEFDANIIQVDSFFLPKEKRTDESAGNIDICRIAEILKKLSENKIACYKPYNCSRGDFDCEITASPDKLTIVEGSYSCHPDLWGFYDLHIFLDISKDEQIKRIRKRNGEEKAKQFESMWIPREEKYFDEFKIEQKCEIKGYYK